MLDHANYPQELRYIESILFVALFESNMNITMYGFFLALHFKGKPYCFCIQPHNILKKSNVIVAEFVVSFTTCIRNIFIANIS